MSKKGDFDAVRKDIVGLLHQPEYDDGSAGPVLVRLAWCVYSFRLPLNLAYPHTLYKHQWLRLQLLTPFQALRRYL
jgi:hypothetical protein